MIALVEVVEFDLNNPNELESEIHIVVVVVVDCHSTSVEEMIHLNSKLISIGLLDDE
jgi:hypothetical protein